MKKIALLLLLGSFLFANETQNADLSTKTLQIYSANPLNEKLVALFEQKHKSKIEQNTLKLGELIEKAKQNGGDVFIVSDLSNLAKAKEAGIFAPANSKALKELVPPHLRTKDNTIFAFATRARIIAYDKNLKKDANLIKTYDDLAKPEFKGKVLMRSAKAGYSTTLLATIIANEGEEAAKKWASGIWHNLALKPQGGDRAQATQMIEGKGEFAVMNTYYIARLKNSKKEEERKVGEALGIIYPNQDTWGTHINISGIALIKGTKNEKLALEFMEFMLSKEAQKIISDTSYQFPVRNDIKLSKDVEAFGTFKANQTPLDIIIENIPKAKAIYEEIGFE